MTHIILDFRDAERPTNAELGYEILMAVAGAYPIATHWTIGSTMPEPVRLTICHQGYIWRSFVEPLGVLCFTADALRKI